MELMDETGAEPEVTSAEPAAEDGEGKISEQDMKLVARVLSEIKEDKKHHAAAFKRMVEDMNLAMHGATEEWAKANYVANIVGRHVKMKTAALYAKNPKIVAKRRETLDFAVWDETPEALQLAQQTSMLVQQAVAVAQQTPPMVDPVTGMVTPAAPAMPPGADQALAVLADFMEGMKRREFVKKYTKTFEVLISQQLREQTPVDFKTGMKQVVRRTATTGAGYVELGYQREYGPRPGMTEKMADTRARLDHLRVLTEEAGEGEIENGDAEMAELTLAMEQLQKEPEIVLREGLIVDYPQSTKVIPDSICTNLIGFLGSRRLTLEYSYSKSQVKELFGVDLGDSYAGFTLDPKADDSANIIPDDNAVENSTERKGDCLVKVYKQYHKPSGLVYYVAEGHKGFLRPPAAPDVFVEQFWPVFALTFNSVESEKELFPPSDVRLLKPMQEEYNRSRQGMREHRKAARPRWVYSNGVFADEQDPMHLANLEAFEAIGLNVDVQFDIKTVLQVVPVPGVDPNLYETNQLFSDMQLVSGAQEAQYGGTSDATATQSAIAANATNASDASAIDDLDGFLTCIARAAGQILQREMSEEKVVEIVGPGAEWPDMTLVEIANEIYLEIEAGSTGKPNQAVEINNWKQIAPLLLQMPGINPTWLARETLRRLDDRLDLTDAIIAGIPAIVAQNQMMQPNAGDAASDPNAQGAQGANNAEKPNPGPGSDAPMGDNRTTPGQLANDPGALAMG